MTEQRTRKVRTDIWVPTDKQISMIEKYAGIGLTMEDIASLLEISKRTLERHNKEGSIINVALNKGRALSKASVSSTAFKMANNGRTPSMTKYWLNCRAGWSEENSDDGKFDKPTRDPSLEPIEDDK